jgi:LDH2 family malate/lactate/ureidoglycolate dehydrogenase
MKIEINAAFDYAKGVLAALGTCDTHAEVIAQHLVESDAKGVRSHGLLRILRYAEQIESGYIDNRAAPSIETISPALVKVDAHRTWGILALHELLPVVVSNARRHGIAGGAVVNCAHTGRIGAFTEVLAKNFMWGQIFGGGANRRLREVAPFGGARAEFDTNPYSISAPLSSDDVATADFATSATAQGKLLVYRTNKLPVPDGWLIDEQGGATNDPEAFYAGGALLPAGGHKGYGMAFLAELFGEAALGVPHELNWFVIAVDLGALTSRDSYLAHASRLKEKIEVTPPSPGFRKVMWPGQPEMETQKATAAAGGIEYSTFELEHLSELGARLGVAL